MRSLNLWLGNGTALRETRTVQAVQMRSLGEPGMGNDTSMTLHSSMAIATPLDE
jgi:hypothetical protein